MDGQVQIIDIDRLAFGGDGVGRSGGPGGKVVFVPGALPGERVRARIVERRRRFDRARLVDIVVASPDRRVRDCAHERREGCGGCGFRHVDDRLSLEHKARAALSTMRRIGRDVDWLEPQLHPAPALDGARTRARFQVQGRALGFYRRGTHELVEVPGCLALHPDLVEGWRRIGSVLVESAPEPVPDTVLLDLADTGLYATWEGHVGDRARTLLARQVASGHLAGAWATRGDGWSVGAEWVETCVELTEPSRVLRYRRRIGTFAQAQQGTNVQLLRWLEGWLRERPPEGHVLDLYAGSGNLSLIAAAYGRRVTAVELDRRALDGVSESARCNGISGVRPRKRDLRRGLTRRAVEEGAALVLLDPPRSGAAEVIADLLDIGAPRMVYVSCSPPHLARDLQRLSASYRLEALHAFDMFARSPHVELVAVLQATS
jgi:23S rRNA (uracil1939-C5)-methyltransferase